VQTLADLLDRFQEWRDNLPSGLANSATAEALDAVLELRGYVEELQAVELPKGFGGTDDADRRRYRTCSGRANSACHLWGRPHKAAS
jgi:hypothetical protein